MGKNLYVEKMSKLFAVASFGSDRDTYVILSS